MKKKISKERKMKIKISRARRSQVGHKEVNFNFNGKCLFLTYKGWIEQLQIDNLLNDICRNAGGSISKYKYNAVHEESDKETPYKHTHIHVYFKTKKHIRGQARLNIAGVHPHIKFCATSEHFDNLIKYVRKQNQPFVEQLTGNEFKWKGAIRDKIQACSTWGEVINHKEEDVVKATMKYFRWAKECWNYRPRRNLSLSIKLRRWQQEVYKGLYKQNNRKIMWIHDKLGGNGKSVLANYLIDNKSALLVDSGKVADVAYAYNNEEVIIFDLPRCTLDADGKDWTPYRIMEMFKNGRIFSPKYQSCMKRFKPCKVIVLANFLPDVSKLSLDRWDVKDLDQGKLVPRPLNINTGSWNAPAEDGKKNEIFDNNAIKQARRVPTQQYDKVIKDEDYKRRNVIRIT